MVSWKWLVLAALAAAILWLALRPSENQPVSATNPPARRETPRPTPPDLLEPRAATPAHPLESWERLLARDGSPQEDRDALADLVTNYLQAAPDARRPPMGTNDEITRALMDRDTLGDSAIPASHPAIVSGQLVDRWGSPWFFHQLSADVIDVRSAGPDGRLFSDDDIAPPDR